MRKISKRILIVAAMALMLGALALTLTGCFGEQYVTRTYDISEAFTNISMDTDVADIVFVPSTDGTSKVVCYEEAATEHSVKVGGGTLSIESDNTHKWNFTWFSSPKITVYLSAAEYLKLRIKGSTGSVDIPKEFKFGSVDISLSTGNVNCYASVTEGVKVTGSTGGVNLDGASVGSVDIAVSTGKVTLSNVTASGDVKVGVSTGDVAISKVTCKNITSEGDTGSITLSDVTASEKLSVERDTGDVKLERSDAAEIFIETDTGSVTGTLLTEKVFDASSDTGSVDVPESTAGGACVITTDTGNIKITVQAK